MKELHRKKYGLTLEVRKYPILSVICRKFQNAKKPLHFSYKEGTMAEILELRERMDRAEEHKNELMDFIFEFLNKHGKVKENEFYAITEKMFEKVAEKFLKTWGGGYFDKEEGQETDTDDEKMPESASISLLLQSSNETMESLLNLTWQQLDFLIKGIAYIENEKTEEGRLKNMQKGTDAEALKRVKAFEARLNNISKK